MKKKHTKLVLTREKLAHLIKGGDWHRTTNRCHETFNWYTCGGECSNGPTCGGGGDTCYSVATDCAGTFCCG